MRSRVRACVRACARVHALFHCRVCFYGLTSTVRACVRACVRVRTCRLRVGGWVPPPTSWPTCAGPTRQTHSADENNTLFFFSVVDLGVTHVDPGSKADAVDLKMQNDIQHFMEVRAWGVGACARTCVRHALLFGPAVRL